MKKHILVILILAVFLSSGCYSFRKKFVRSKKESKESPVFVNFKEYPTNPSRERYSEYYLFIRGWLDDLTTALSREGSFKRQKRAVNEAIMNMEQIMSFFTVEGQQVLYPIYDELRQFREELIKNPSMSELRRNSYIKKIEQIKRSFEADFNFSSVGRWFPSE